MKRLVFCSLILAGLAACAQITLVPASQQEIGNAYSVNPQITWNKVAGGPGELWTNSGVTLEAVRLYGNLKEGDALFELAGKNKEFPKFDADMRAPEVAEFVVDSLTAFGFGDVETNNLKPTKFGDLSGYRFDLKMVSGQGLEFDGLAAGAVEDGKLHLILYYGPSAYYFPEYKDEVEGIIASVTTST